MSAALAIVPSAEPVDLDAAAAFLALLDEGAERFSFQTFDDSPAKRHDLARIFHGTFAEHAPALTRLNQAGAGIFVTVNETDLHGRKTANVQRIRAVFADTDGSPLVPIMTRALEPHIVVESSPGKWHAYWLVDGLPLAEFTAVQKAIAAKFGTDPSVCDLPRVMRVPGFDHRKGKRFRVRVIHESGALPYAAARVRAEFVPAPATAAATVASAGSTGPQGKPDSDGDRVEVNRHQYLLKRALLMASAVKGGSITRTDALAALFAERDGGKYTREVPDREIIEALDGALAKPGTAPNDAKPSGAPTPNDRPRLLQLVRADQIKLTPIVWTIRDYLVAETLAGLVGASGAGKSFVALGMACAIGTGTPWHGRDVHQGAVFYLAGEGQRGLKKRIAAWERHTGISTDGAPIYLSAGLPFLCDLTIAEASADEIGEEADKLFQESGIRPALIVIDTVARAMAGANESSTEDMGTFVRACDLLRQRWACTVLCVHHSGHAATERARGSSAFYAALDSEFFVTAKDGIVMFAGTKEKDWPKPSAISFEKVVVPITVPTGDGETIEESGMVLHDIAGALLEQNKREQALALHRAGQSIRDIAVQLGCPKSSVGRWLKCP